MFARNVAPGVWRLPFESSTLPPFDHTNGWLITQRDRAVLIDPGFRDLSGLEMLQGALAASGATELEAVWLTHTHTDHVEGLGRLRDLHPTVEVFVHELEISRLDVTSRTVPLRGGDALDVGGRAIRVLHTPGHSPGHVAYLLEDVGWGFVGDLVAGRGPVWVGSPEGDVAAYLGSLDRVARERARVLAPGHGDPLTDPEAAISWARRHRLDRETQILAVLRGASRAFTVPELRARVYADLATGLEPLAERALVAHLEKLVAESRIQRVGSDPSFAYRA